ncbi:metal-sulfur cluster assembly factor [Actinotignum sanguinis]|uniref:metal-sulfur cluster assembly factor n=1 Tax=Actinotignum sanguinis TaxID=1445614 RepID=UPI0029352D17|nr:metal-sulfur cluster assembly factor [Actinotignum sanguinis]MDV2437256.1 metal-sulfur cluster assembly factor [Actinotignum sanguinis]
MTEKKDTTPPEPEATAPVVETLSTTSTPQPPPTEAGEHIGEVIYTDGDSPVDDVDPYLVLEAMKDVIDPELGVNIVDLGLVYGVTTNGRHLHLDMTLTSPACPLTDAITNGIIIATEDLVDDVDINWVWLPPWGPERITEDGRDDLRALGFNI